MIGGPSCAILHSEHEIAGAGGFSPGIGEREGTDMLSEKRAALAVRVLSLVLIAVFSFFVVAAVLPETDFVKDSLESVEESSDTVMQFSAATLSTSLAISALPDDFATPLADSLADMNIYFVAILVVLNLEKLLVLFGIKAAFKILIPAACVAGGLFIVTKRDVLKSLAIRLCVLGLALAFVVPCSTHITTVVASDLTAYVNETIEEAESGAGKLNEAMESDAGDKTIFEKLSDLFQTAIDGVSDLMRHFQNTIRRCMNSIAILVLTDCVMPVLTFFVLKWILGEVFHVTILMPPVRRWRGHGSRSDTELVPGGKEEP